MPAADHRHPEPRSDVDPIDLAYEWLDAAEAAGLPNPSAAVLSTVSADGRPSARAVLIRTRQPDGFAFFTNYESRKAEDLAANPGAALTCVWHELHRQLRIEGLVTVAPGTVSDAYWASRPPGSRVSAAASPQSRPIPGRQWLESQVREIAEASASQPPARPSTWGGYIVVPDRIEFWTGRPDRLHDRTAFARDGDGPWSGTVLAP